jgi:hypothetical protein
MPRTATTPRINKAIVIEEAQALGHSGVGEMPIDELRRRVERRHGFNRHYLQKSKVALQNKLLREVLEEAVDAQGLPIFVNLRVADARTGGQRHVYKPRLRLDAEEYRQAIQYRVDMANKHIRIAVGMHEEAKLRRGLQMDLRFETPQA